VSLRLQPRWRTQRARSGRYSGARTIQCNFVVSTWSQRWRPCTTSAAATCSFWQTAQVSEVLASQAQLPDQHQVRRSSLRNFSGDRVLIWKAKVSEAHSDDPRYNIRVGAWRLYIFAQIPALGAMRT